MSNFFEKWVGKNAARQKLVFEEKFILDVTENVWEVMQRIGVNKVQLAERLGKSKAYVSQLLNGSRNMTLRSLADICFALDVSPKITLEGQADENNGEWSYSGNIVRMQDYIARSQEIQLPEPESEDGWMRIAK